MDSRMAMAEAHIEQIDARLDKIEEKLDLLIQCEADRKADDRALKRYAKVAFWGLISLGGFINWDKISKAADAFVHQVN